jgi:Flp pilus assembly protein TadD
MSKNSANKGNERQGMSFSAIIVAGFFCALLLLSTVIVVRHIHIIFTPTLSNSEHLLSKGKPRDAVAMLDKVEKENAKSGGAPVRDAKTLVLRGKAIYALLVEELRTERWGSYGKNPSNWIQNPLADEVERCFTEAIELAPNDPEIKLLLGNLYREQGRFADAENVLRSALALDESNAEIFLTLGLLYAEGRRPDAAEKALAYAWELDPRNPRIAKNMAYFYRYYRDIPESSVVWFTRYLDLDPQKDPEVNIIRGELKNLLEHYPEFEKYRKQPEERKGFSAMWRD